MWNKPGFNRLSILLPKLEISLALYSPQNVAAFQSEFSSKALHETTQPNLNFEGFCGVLIVSGIFQSHFRSLLDGFGTENNPETLLKEIDSSIELPNNPSTKLNKSFDSSSVDTVFLSLPHGVSHKYVKLFYNKLQLIDLSADFRLDDIETYKINYDEKHCIPNLLNEFVYGLPEINKNKLINKKNIAVPGCYPTSVLIPLIPLLKNNIISLILKP